MEAGRRKSSASDFFSRRFSGTLFKSLRRFSSNSVITPNESESKFDQSNKESDDEIVNTVNKCVPSEDEIKLDREKQAYTSTHEESLSPPSSEKWKHYARTVLTHVEETEERNSLITGIIFTNLIN